MHSVAGVADDPHPTRTPMIKQWCANQNEALRNGRGERGKGGALPSWLYSMFTGN